MRVFRTSLPTFVVHFDDGHSERCEVISHCDFDLYLPEEVQMASRHMKRPSMSYFKKHYLFFILAVLGLHCCAGFSLIAGSGDYSLVAVRGLLIVVASLVVEHGL